MDRDCALTAGRVCCYRMHAMVETFSRLRYISIRAATFAVILLAFSAGAASPTAVKNDDSCDLGHAPAATLLLPYFEVDLEDRTGDTTLFTITNVTNIERIARVTLWTDLAYPVITFNVYLTGYDVQSFNLWDIVAGQGIALPGGTGTVVSNTGDRSGPNSRLDLSNCRIISSHIYAATLERMQQAFTLGQIDGVCNEVGGTHQHAVGYATIDVVGNCANNGPADAAYFTEDIRYDNVLIGDYQHVNGSENFAQGGPMVHIRAIPEGRTPQTRSLFPTRFSQTFYGRLQPAAQPLLDARQPLPSVFAARWINGGTGDFQTSFRIWRQGVSAASANCADYEDNERPVAESIVFDEHENGEGSAPESCDITCIGVEPISLRPSASIDVEPGSETFPQAILSAATSGWVYVNLDDDDAATLGAPQAWVIATMRAEGRYSVDFDAAWLGNGCSPFVPMTSYSDPSLPPPGNATTPTHPNAVLPGPAADVNP